MVHLSFHHTVVLFVDIEVPKFSADCEGNVIKVRKYSTFSSSLIPSVSDNNDLNMPVSVNFSMDAIIDSDMMVEWTVRDAQGNTAKCVQQIQVFGM